MSTAGVGRACPASGAASSDPLSGEELYAALEQAGVALAQGDPATARILRVNREFCELTGYSEAELLERTFFEITHPEDRAADYALYEPVTRGWNRTWRSEKRYVRKDGEVRWVAVRGAVICADEHGAPLRTAAVILDITELKRTEEALRRSEDRYRCLVEATAESVWTTSPDGLTYSESARRCSMTGQQPAGLTDQQPAGLTNQQPAGLTGQQPAGLTGQQPAGTLGQGCIEAVHPDDRERILRRWTHAIATMSRYETEYRVRSAGGGYRLTQARAVPVVDRDGRVREWVGMNIDITERRQTEERFRAAQELSLDAFVVLRAVRDGRGEIVDFVYDFANPAAGRLLRMPIEAIVGRRFLELLPAQRADLFSLYVRVVETGEPHDKEIARQVDGRRTWVRNMAVKIGDGVAVSFHDITARKQAEESLREADRRKDEFLAMLAHELRNPLSAMQFALGVSQLPSVPEARRAWALSVMQRQLRQLGRMVDDLLDVSRITRGKIALKKEPLDLHHVIQQAVTAAAPLIDAARLELSVDAGEGPYWVFGDSARLEQVIVNLLTNAAKYTREGGRIWLTARREGAEVVIRVRDTGIGIPAEMLPRIFDLFEQAHPTLDRSRGGLGIGLTLVKRLVEMHGGAVSAASEGEGRGSELTVRLPVTEAPAHPREPAAPPRRGLARRILVVDDNRDHAQGLSLLLEQAGHAVALAHDGPSALEMARSFAPEVILLDIGLPDMDGYEVARRLREEQGERALRIVALTGYGQYDDRRRSKEAGCDAHLVKPVAHEVLLEQLAL